MSAPGSAADSVIQPTPGSPTEVGAFCLWAGTYGHYPTTGHAPARHPTTLLMASAASPLVAQVLTKAFTLPAQPGVRVTVEDVVPLPADDPRGVAAPYLVLGLLIGGYIGAMVIGRLIGMRSP